MTTLVFVVALLVTYMAAPATSATTTTQSTTTWRTQSTTTRRTESTSTSTRWTPERTTTTETATTSTRWTPDTSNSTRYNLNNPWQATDEERIKSFIQTAKSICPHCQTEAEHVRIETNKSEICKAVERYGSCTFVSCYGSENVNSWYVQAHDMCANSTSYNTDPSTTWPTNDEGRIKHYIQLAKSTCSKCQTDAEYALTRSYKTDICNAVNMYGSCSLVYCYGTENVNSFYVQAQDLCDTKAYSLAGTDVIQASMLAVLATAAVARFLF